MIMKFAGTVLDACLKDCSMVSALQQSFLYDNIFQWNFNRKKVDFRGKKYETDIIYISPVFYYTNNSKLWQRMTKIQIQKTLQMEIRYNLVIPYI